MVQKYLDLGLSVIIEHPFKTEEEIDSYTEIANKRHIPIHKFQLHADPNVALQRVVNRTKENNGDLTEERARRNISLFQPRGHLGFNVIDTTDVKPQDIAEIVLKEITR